MRTLLTLHASVFLLSSLTLAQGPGEVLRHQKISEIEGALPFPISDGDRFGSALIAFGDVNLDGVTDLFVGAPQFGNGDGQANYGAIHALALRANGTVRVGQTIGPDAGNFGGTLGTGDLFGSSLAAPGDLNADLRPDLVVGAPGTPGGGAVWTVYLSFTLLSTGELVFAEGAGGFTGDLDEGDAFGAAVAALGDLDGDGNADLAVGAPGDDDGALDAGAVWILFLNADGTVGSHQKISSSAGGFGGTLFADDAFGTSVAQIGDLDGDGIVDLAVGAARTDGTDADEGAVWILFLDTDGTVKGQTQIREGVGGLTASLGDSAQFGSGVAAVGDVDGDGTTDLAIGVRGDAQRGMRAGAVVLAFLNDDGTVASERRITHLASGFRGQVDPFDLFGAAVAALGDFDQNGTPDLLIGAPADDDGTGIYDGPLGRGALYLTLLSDGTQTLPAQATRFGCRNPEATLRVLQGEPIPGTTLRFGLRNTVGTQSAGSIPFLATSLVPYPMFPCGFLLPSFGMNGAGELLVRVNGPNLAQPIQSGMPWAGLGTFATIDINLPPSPSLLGTFLLVQGLLLDGTPGSVRFGLTEAYELRVGP